MTRRIPARGNAPGTCTNSCSALQGLRIPAPLQGAPIDSETQGVALGWSAAALSAPESKLCKSDFTILDGRPCMRWLLVTSSYADRIYSSRISGPAGALRAHARGGNRAAAGGEPRAGEFAAGDGGISADLAR